MNIVNQIRENEGVIVLSIVIIIFATFVGLFRYSEKKYHEEKIQSQIDSAYQAGKNDITLSGLSMINNEIWKPIEGYEGIYEISNYGNVKSLKRKVGTCYRKEKLLTQLQDGDGYKTVHLYNKNKSKVLYVHRLVALAFIPNPQNKPCIDHINTIRYDNNVNNLRWTTVKENCNNPITVNKHKKQNNNIFFNKVD